MPISEIEPPRNVPAAAWKSPYCAKWDDGCTECTRTAVDAEPDCRPATDYIGAGVCEPRGILCANSIRNESYSELERICWETASIFVSRPGVTGISPLTLQLGGISYDAEAGRWRSGSVELAASEDADQIARRAMKSFGRHPDTEFELTDRKFIATLYCARARKAGGGGMRHRPAWLEKGRGE